MESYLPADTSRPVLEWTCGDVLRRAAGAVPERVALAEVADEPLTGADRTDRRWTYAELLADAEHAAAWLAARFSPGEHVAVWAPNVPEWVVLQYGASLAGLVLVTANPALREAELEYVLARSGAAGVFFVDSFRGTRMGEVVEAVGGRLASLRERVGFTGWLREIRGAEPGPLPVVAAGSAAQIQYTSGTTGHPKGALLHHRGLVTNAGFVTARAGFGDGGVWATALPLFHTAGCGLSVLGTGLARGTLVLAQVFAPDLVLRAIQDHRAHVFGGVPAMFAGLLAHPGFDSYDLSSCGVVMSGGDAVPVELAEEASRRFGARFSTVYGQTELSPILTQSAPGEVEARPLWQAEVKVVDRAGAVVPRGVAGEICARGYQVMLGYHDMPEATAAAIDDGGWLHTGDLGVMDELGHVRVTGRLKDMIIRGGENIYPREIEAVLAACPGVAAAVVLGVPDTSWGEQVAAVVVPAGEAPAAAVLHDHVRTVLASYKTPRYWYTAAEIPVNAMGKVQKFLLRDRIAGGDLPELR